MKSTDWHLITSEYPPQTGGVSDYTELVAAGLASAGDEVHVWCPPAKNGAASARSSEGGGAAGVFVHRELGRFAPADLRRAGSMLDRCRAPRRLLVQWVPHGYGYQSMNLPFCMWLLHRAVRRGDVVEIMVHEPYLSFGEGSWRQSGVAAIHRLMAMVLLKSARRVLVSIPAWEESLRPYTLGSALKFQWLPVTSNIAVVDDPEGVRATRALYAPAGEQVVGHFGTYERHIAELLFESVPALLRGRSRSVMLLLGHGGESVRDQLISKHAELAGRVHATGTLDAATLSRHITACDVLVQPFIDGVSSRRTSVMVGLSHGLPIVTTSGRLTEPLWAESEAVALVPVEDVRALVDATHGLLTDATMRKRMSAAARALYQERFDVQRTINTLREVAI